ncbi:MAG TPA: hypothetical protein VIJ58_09035 [Candidatus Dormibacteraeota bacterium]
MGLEVLALAPWVFTAVIGAWLVLTGRRLIPWLPEGVRDGWRLRAIGLLYCVVAALFANWVIQGPFDPSALVISWIAVGTGVWVAFVRWRKTGTRGA